MLPSTYQEAAKVHLVKDREVTWDKLPKVETLLNRHTSALRKIINIRESHRGQMHRLGGALRSKDSPAPPLYLLWNL